MGRAIADQLAGSTVQRVVHDNRAIPAVEGYAPFGGRRFGSGAREQGRAPGGFFP